MKNRHYLIRIAKALFYLPGTFAHEFSHLLFALVFARQVRGFNIIPDFKEGTAGSVQYISTNGAASMLISFAPKLYWFALVYFLNYLSVVKINYELQSCMINLAHINWKSPFSLISLYLIIQLLWAGSLSFKDWENILKGLFSLSGLLLVLFIVTLAFVLFR